MGFIKAVIPVLNNVSNVLKAVASMCAIGIAGIAVLVGQIILLEDGVTEDEQPP